jgi:uncharacterized protein YqeY
MIVDELKSKLVEYRKAGEADRVSVLSFFLSQVKNKEIELRPQNQELTDEIVFKILRKQVKDRKEVIETCKRANREDKLKQEQQELAILMEFAKLFPFELNLDQQQGPRK